MTTWGTIFLATDLLLTNDDLMEKHVLYLLDKGPNNKGKILMTRINDHFMEKLLRGKGEWRKRLHRILT